MASSLVFMICVGRMKCVRAPNADGRPLWSVQIGSPDMNSVCVSKKCQLPVLPALDNGESVAATDIQQPPRLGTRGDGDGCHPHRTQFQLPDGARTTEIVSSTSRIFASLFAGCGHGGGGAALSCFARISS